MAHCKRLVISGYYGFSNTGDEAVLSAIVQEFRAQAGDEIEITVLSGSPKETAKTHRVKAVNRMSFSSVISAIRKCDLLISGGGSLIQDVTSFHSAVYYLSIIAMAKVFRRKVMILGQGVGPLRGSLAQALTAGVLGGVDLITVRDPESAEMLKSLGVRRPPIRVTADPTFTLRKCTDEEAVRLLSEAGLSAGENIIAIALREWPTSGSAIEEAAMKALKSFISKTQVRILLITMQTPEDMPLAHRIKTAIPESVIQPEPYTPEQLLGVLGRCRLVVAMRLHALIFAAAAGVPVLGIEYDPKVEQFLESTGQKSITLDETVSGLLEERISAAWAERDALAAKLSEMITPMRAASRENIRLALGLLKKSVNSNG